MWKESDCSKCNKRDFCCANVECCPWYDTEVDKYQDSKKFEAYDRLMRENKGVRV